MEIQNKTYKIIETRIEYGATLIYKFVLKDNNKKKYELFFSNVPNIDCNNKTNQDIKINKECSQLPNFLEIINKCHNSLDYDLYREENSKEENSNLTMKDTISKNSYYNLIKL